MSFIDHNLQKILVLSRFCKLSNASALVILNNEKRVSKKIDLFLAFKALIKDRDDLPENIKSQMIACFEMKSFTRSEIQNNVRKTGFYTDKDIFNALQEKYDELEETLKAQELQLESQQMQLESQKEQIITKTNQLDYERDLTTKLKRKLENDPNVCLAQNGGRLLSSPSSIIDDRRVDYEFQDIELINKVEFTLNVAYGYSIESSIAGYNWAPIVDYPVLFQRFLLPSSVPVG